jgi:ubiquinone/menaquinone biosynthesis C-methylase UbiE
MTTQNIWLLNKNAIHRQERRAQTTAFLLNPHVGDTILDIGCAEGFVTNNLAQASLVVGLDRSIGSLLIAKQKVKQTNIDFICADATSLPLKETAFNKATMLEVLEHLPKEAQKKACSQVDRVLKKGGLFVISVPYKEEITYRQRVHRGNPVPLWGHLHSMDEKNVTSLLPSRYALVASCHIPNVELISLATIFWHLPPRLWLIFNNLLGKIRKGYWILLKYKKG